MDSLSLPKFTFSLVEYSIVLYIEERGVCKMSRLIAKGPNRFTHIPLMFVRVLVLDDNDFDRRRVRRLLQLTNFNHSLDESRSIREFENRVKTNRYDVALLDFDLPDGTGFEALEILHGASQDFFVGSLMISGQNCFSIEAKAMELGFAAYIAKQNLSLQIFKPALCKAIGVEVI